MGSPLRPVSHLVRMRAGLYMLGLGVVNSYILREEKEGIVLGEILPYPALQRNVSVGPAEEYDEKRSWDPEATSPGKAKNKRAALLLDKIMFAVQKAIEENGGRGNISPQHMVSFTGGSDGERLAVGGNKVYWRCYFNAVSCF